MSLIDLIKSSPHRAIGYFSVANRDCSAAVDMIRDILTSANWTFISPIQAYASLSFPSGLPTGSAIDVTNIIAGFVGDIELRWYHNPDHPDPSGQHDGSFLIYGVPTGLTMLQSAENMATVIAGLGWLTTVVPDGIFYDVNATALALGTAGNGVMWGSGGNLGSGVGSGLSKGGGWTLRSRSQQDIDPTSSNNIGTTIDVTTDTPTFGQAKLVVTTDGLPGISFGMQTADWTLIAADYYALFYGPAPYHGGDIYVNNALMFCGTPSIPTSIAAAAGFVIYPNGQGSVGAGIPGPTNYTIVNSKEMAGDTWGQHKLSFCFYHYQGGYELEVRTGKTLLLPALMMMLCSPINHDPDDSRVVGYLWDSFIDTAYQAPGTIVDQEHIKYICIFGQSGPSQFGSVFMRMT